MLLMVPLFRLMRPKAQRNKTLLLLLLLPTTPSLPPRPEALQYQRRATNRARCPARQAMNFYPTLVARPELARD
jgi:hypothetical protein